MKHGTDVRVGSADDGYWCVPKLWPGETAVCIGGGPSLMPEDVAWCRGRARVIAVNDAYRIAPWADLLYACDAKWWRWHGGVPTFTGLKATLEPAEFPGIRRLRRGPLLGLATAPDTLATGRNGGYQAINLAVHLGATRILLLGFDMRRIDGRAHWFGDHPVPSQPDIHARAMLPCFDSLPGPLAARGVEVLNCTPGSALTVFANRPLRSILPSTRV